MNIRKIYIIDGTGLLIGYFIYGGKDILDGDKHRWLASAIYAINNISTQIGPKNSGMQCIECDYAKINLFETPTKMLFVVFSSIKLDKKFFDELYLIYSQSLKDSFFESTSSLRHRTKFVNRLNNFVLGCNKN